MSVNIFVLADQLNADNNFKWASVYGSFDVYVGASLAILLGFIVSGIHLGFPLWGYKQLSASSQYCSHLWALQSFGKL
jgi:hypothetical protein